MVSSSIFDIKCRRYGPLVVDALERHLPVFVRYIFCLNDVRYAVLTCTVKTEANNAGTFSGWSVSAPSP